MYNYEQGLRVKALLSKFRNLIDYFTYMIQFLSFYSKLEILRLKIAICPHYIYICIRILTIIKDILHQ